MINDAPLKDSIFKNATFRSVLESKTPTCELKTCNPDPSAYVDQMKYYMLATPDAIISQNYAAFSGFDSTKYLVKAIDELCVREKVPELVGCFIVSVDNFDIFFDGIPVSIRLDYKGPPTNYLTAMKIYLREETGTNFSDTLMKNCREPIQRMINGYKRHKNDLIYDQIMRATTVNDISKGENEMANYKTEAQIRYEEKCNEAKKAYDEALRIAKEELDAAEQKKSCYNAAGIMKDLYDSYIEAGFTEEQAMKFVTIALENQGK